MMRLAAWTPTDADLVTLPSTAALSFPRRRCLALLKTAHAQSKNQMRKFPSFVRRAKKTLFSQKDYVKRLDYFSFKQVVKQNLWS